MPSPRNRKLDAYMRTNLPSALTLHSLVGKDRPCRTFYRVAFLVHNRDQSAYRILWPHPRRTLPLFSLRDKKVRNTYAEASATSLEASNTRYRALRLDRASLKATPTIYISTCVG